MSCINWTGKLLSLLFWLLFVGLLVLAILQWRQNEKGIMFKSINDEIGIPSITICPYKYYQPLQTVELKQSLTEKDLSKVPNLKENVRIKLSSFKNGEKEVAKDEIVEFFWIEPETQAISKCIYVEIDSPNDLYYGVACNKFGLAYFVMISLLLG